MKDRNNITSLPARDIARFRARIYRHFKKKGRHLPWRDTRDPYKILVSEVMLQQTQVDRVIPKYHAFLKEFPTVETLAKAPLSRVVAVWQGLGYNRRAKYLLEAAQNIMREHGGNVPNNQWALEALPGIGRYSAAAIAAFAFSLPTLCLETNIKTVYLHFFFENQKKVRDQELLALLRVTIDRHDPRRWYAALMDYGSWLKKEGVRNLSQSAQYKKQSAFKGSPRELRGKIVRTLIVRKRFSLPELQKHTCVTRKKLHVALATLLRDGLVTQKGRIFSLA